MSWSMALITAQDWSGDPVKPHLPASGVRHNRLPEALLNPQLPQLSLYTIMYPSYYRIVTRVHQKNLSHVRVNEELADFANESSRLVAFQNLIPNEICPRWPSSSHDYLQSLPLTLEGRELPSWPFAIQRYPQSAWTWSRSIISFRWWFKHPAKNIGFGGAPDIYTYNL